MSVQYRFGYASRLCSTPSLTMFQLRPGIWTTWVQEWPERCSWGQKISVSEDPEQFIQGLLAGLVMKLTFGENLEPSFGSKCSAAYYTSKADNGFRNLVLY